MNGAGLLIIEREASQRQGIEPGRSPARYSTWALIKINSKNSIIMFTIILNKVYINLFNHKKWWQQREGWPSTHCSRWRYTKRRWRYFSPKINPDKKRDKNNSIPSIKCALDSLFFLHFHFPIFISRKFAFVLQQQKKFTCVANRFYFR